MTVSFISNSEEIYTTNPISKVMPLNISTSSDEDLAKLEGIIEDTAEISAFAKRLYLLEV